MKYPKELYEETEFYPPDEEISNSQQKIVKTRKEHECSECRQLIPAGAHALHESCFWDGPKHTYLCIQCCEEWMDEIYAYEREANA